MNIKEVLKNKKKQFTTLEIPKYIDNICPQDYIDFIVEYINRNKKFTFNELFDVLIECTIINKKRVSNDKINHVINMTLETLINSRYIVETKKEQYKRLKRIYDDSGLIVTEEPKVNITSDIIECVNNLKDFNDINENKHLCEDNIKIYSLQKK